MSYASYTYQNSEHALTRAILNELDSAGESLLHGPIHISCAAEFLANGIKRCSVQVQCKAGCGYLIQAFGEEADVLQEKAITIQRLLREAVQKGSFNSLLQELSSVFPERQPTKSS